MPSPTEITVAQLSRLIGTPGAPVIIDVRTEDDYAADPRLVPGSVRRDFATVASWAQHYTGKPVVVSCQKGLKLSQGVAAWLRHEGIAAEPWKAGSWLGMRRSSRSFAPRLCPNAMPAGVPSG